jgi:hypothetical protein
MLMLKYRLVIHWHRTPSNADKYALTFWSRYMDANNRKFLLDTSGEIMKTLRNVKRIEVLENLSAEAR